MARALGIEFRGAVCPITSRENEKIEEVKKIGGIMC